MVDAEDRKIKERERAAHEQEERDRKAGKGNHSKQEDHKNKKEHKDDKKEGSHGEPSNNKQNDQKEKPKPDDTKPKK